MVFNLICEQVGLFGKITLQSFFILKKEWWLQLYQNISQLGMIQVLEAQGNRAEVYGYTIRKLRKKGTQSLRVLG